MELTENSTIKELIESKKPLKSLRLILSKRDTTIKEVFNSAGYFYEAKLHQWIKQEDGQIKDDTSFRKALEKLKGTPTTKSKKKQTNTELIKTNKVEPIETNNGLIETNNGLIETNNELIELNSLSSIHFSNSELEVLKLIINERIMGEHQNNDIYKAISKLQGRSRKNKTYYISEELTTTVESYCEKMGIKLSLFVEIALIETLNKYKK